MQGLTVKQRMIKIHFNARATFNSVCASTKTAPTIPAYLANSSQNPHDDVIKCKYIPVTGEFPAQRPVKRSFDVFLDLRLNRRFSKREAGDLRCHRAHYDVTVIIDLHVTVHWWLMGRGKAWNLSKKPTNPTDQVPWENILYGIWFLWVSFTWIHFHGMKYIVVHLISTWGIQLLITDSQIPICNGRA